MLSFLKVFARGIIVTLLLPVIVLVLVLYGVYCLGLFVFMFFKGVIDYFRGNNFNAELPEDNTAKRILLEKEKSESQAKDMLNMMYQQTMAQAAFNQNLQENPAKNDGIDYLRNENNEPSQEESSIQIEGEDR